MATKKEKSEKSLYVELERRWDEFKRDDNASSLERILAIDDSTLQTDESRSALDNSKIKARYLLARHYLGGDQKKEDKYCNIDCNQALSYLEQIAEVTDLKSEVRELRARVYFSLKKFGKAVPLLEECYLDETDEQRKKEFRLLLATAIIEVNNSSETGKQWISSNKIPEVNMDVAIYYISISLTVPCYYMERALDVLDEIKVIIPDQEFVKRRNELVRNHRLVVFDIVDYYTKSMSSDVEVKDDKTQKEHEYLGRFVLKHLERLLNVKQEYLAVLQDIKEGDTTDHEYVANPEIINSTRDAAAWLRYANLLYITGKYTEAKFACEILVKIEDAPKEIKYNAQFIDVVASYMMETSVNVSVLNELEQAFPINSLEWSFVRGILAINYINNNERSKAKKLVRETPFFMQGEEPVRIEYECLKRVLKENGCL